MKHSELYLGINATLPLYDKCPEFILVPKCPSLLPVIIVKYIIKKNVLLLYRLNPDVQYRAVELFHRFMVKHIEELYAHVQNSADSSSPIMWSDVEQRLKHQITLRAVSCVQLASKLSSHYHLVTINRARIFLSKCGFRYAQTSVVQSEVRVLKTINFRVHNPTPLEYIEALLGALSKENEHLPVKQLHGISLKLLDMFYLTRETVFANFLHLVQLRNGTKGKMGPMHGLSVDSMILAASIITAASLVLYECIDMQWIVSVLCDIAKVESQDIIDYSWVLMREVFSDDLDPLEDA